MLCLSRRVRETIVIDGGIVITITEIRQGKVRFAIEAPRSIKIHRGEVAKSIEKEMNDVNDRS